MASDKKRIYITIAGLSDTGKTTIAALIEDFLTLSRIKVISCKERGHAVEEEEIDTEAILEHPNFKERLAKVRSNVLVSIDTQQLVKTFSPSDGKTITVRLKYDKD